MNLLWAALIVAVVSVVAVTAMLFVRRRAPEGRYFEDGDRAAGVSAGSFTHALSPRFIRMIRAGCLEARRISGEDVVVPGATTALRFEQQSAKEVE